MRHFRKLRKIKQKQIAKERIEILSNLIKKDPKNPYNKRYKELIKKIKEKYKIRNI